MGKTTRKLFNRRVLQYIRHERLRAEHIRPQRRVTTKSTAISRESIQFSGQTLKMISFNLVES